MRFILGGALTLCLATGAIADSFQADVWVDNWFALYANGRKVAEDQVSLATERSFNAESFSFEAKRPVTLALIAKDFKENDTGLEYIGTRKQQMGDGGAILQIRDGRGKTIMVSDKDWRCSVIHEAPINKACAKAKNPRPGQGFCRHRSSEPPRGWTAAYFDDSNWLDATEYPKRKVRPKGGYDQIDWDRAAEFIWGPDLETNNTIICRATIK